jgi:O-methyltransferase involved in polyketide biosynthesis
MQELASGRHARLLARRFPASLTTHIALRARHYDRCAQLFLAERQDGLVVNLGAGFDTRYWRIAAPADRYVETDLPDVVALKRCLLGDRATYEMIGCSVLDDRWLIIRRGRQPENRVNRSNHWLRVQARRED